MTSPDRDIPNLADRFAGCLLGQAVGDAMGMPWEGASPETVAAARSTLLEDFPSRRATRSGKGQYGDDTQMTRATVESILERRRVDAADVARRFGELWSSDEIVGQDSGCREAVLRILSGAATWEDAGTPVGRAGNGSALRAAPAGLFLFADADAVRTAASDLSRITHKDPRCTAGAVAVASAVAWCLVHDRMDAGDFARTVAGAARRYHPEFANLIERVPAWTAQPPETAAREIAAAARIRGERGETGIPSHVVPTVLFSLVAFLRTPEDWSETVRTALLAGGDTDTTAALAGALSGAWNGSAAVPAALASRVHDRGGKGEAYLRGLAGSLHRLATGAAAAAR